MRSLQWHPPPTPPNSLINTNKYAQKTYRHLNSMHTPSDPPAASARCAASRGASPPSAHQLPHWLLIARLMTAPSSGLLSVMASLVLSAIASSLRMSSYSGNACNIMYYIVTHVFFSTAPQTSHLEKLQPPKPPTRSRGGRARPSGRWNRPARPPNRAYLAAPVGLTSRPTRPGNYAIRPIV